MPNPFFTVITVTYNSSQFVRDAIESVLASTFTDFELIIGDDCSTDNTWEIINEYDDSRIVKYRNETNLREYPNRNKALGMARGEWVIFIDGDDIIYSHSMFVLREILLNYSEISLAVMCPENSNYIAPLKLNSKQIYEIEFSEFGLINRALTHTVYKTEILKSCPFEIDGFVGLDTLNRLQILSNESCLLIQDNLTWWRRSPNQASNRIAESLRNEMFLMSTELFNNSKCPLSATQKADYLRNAKVKLIRRFFKFILLLKIGKAWKLLLANKMDFSDVKYIFCTLNMNNPMFVIDEKIRFSIK
jgi:glycosyltransferase involved in cell wall biosynthesis